MIFPIPWYKSSIKIKTLTDEVFQDYKKPSMLIGTSVCDWKCCKDMNVDTSICQNSDFASHPTIEIPVEKIYQRYHNNGITHAIIFGGLEPFLQFDEILSVIYYFRMIENCVDDFVIYTGYYPTEIQYQLIRLKNYENIIVKFGRYRIDDVPFERYDPILGIKLASSNQFAMKIS